MGLKYRTRVCKQYIYGQRVIRRPFEGGNKPDYLLKCSTIQHCYNTGSMMLEFRTDNNKGG
jgi:hypothetical protein